MEAEVRISQGDDVAEFASLWEWLRGERALMGAVSAVRSQPGETELGGAFDLLTVALESGGAGVVLARSLITWLQTRRPNIAITVISDSGRVEITTTGLNASEAMSLLHEALEVRDEP